MFKNAAERSGTVPWVFVTDGLSDFVKPARKAFWRRIGRRLVHVVETHAQNEFNHNNVQECLNGTLKPSLHIRGGFKIGNSPLVGLIILGYNFFRSHKALDGKTPADAAGIHVAALIRYLLNYKPLRRRSYRVQYLISEHDCVQIRCKEKAK